MRIILDIPAEFEEHFWHDRFDDSLHRLSADAHLLAGNYEQETAMMLAEALKAAKVLEAENELESDGGCEQRPNTWEVQTIYYGDGQHSYTLYRCPVCRARYMSPTDYCPHCGKPLNRTEG